MYFLLIIGVIASFPVSVFVGRTHLGYLVVGRERSEQPRWAYALATLFLAGSCGIAVGIKNLGVVQGVGGGVGNSFVNLVVPAFALLAMLKKHGPQPVKVGPTDVESGKGSKAEDKGEGLASPGDALYHNELFVNESELQLDEINKDTPSPGSGDKDASRTLSKDTSRQLRRDETPTNELDNALRKDAPEGHSTSSSNSKDKIRLRLRQLPAFFLLAVASLQASVAIIGNIVSLVLVGWDNATNKFY